jgi:hypothetical protein
MAADITSDDFVAKPVDSLADEAAALEAAHAQALAELSRIRDKASVDDSVAGANAHYSMHDVAGVGRYVIPRYQGWKALLDIIHDPVPNIDFSANIYPAFDGILGQHFQSPYLLDPLDDKYESFEDLRDNIAAVRNFLMQSYYTNTPEGMSPEKAKESLAEIAGFVGDGLYNNWLFLGVIPNHNPTKPFISLTEASKPNGKGAQYLYEKILEHQRHSNWMRPFSAVAALFGGKPAPDWMLPPADKTHFTDAIATDITTGMPPLTAAAGVEQEAAAKLAAIQARLGAVRDARLLSNTAIDLDAIGNHLIYTATNMDGVAQMSDPVRRDAVEIARDILRKLKLSIGDVMLVDGLKMKPSDDVATLGAIKGVAMVYERLLAWARGNNDSAIFQHPSVMAATQAIGQLGYQAKREALRYAEMAGNHGLIKTISEQISRLPTSYTQAGRASFGSLLETVERGIDTVIQRTQQVNVSGAKVGFSVDSSMGSSLSAAPTAGTSNQVGVNQAAQRNAQAAVADQLAAQAQANRIHGQLAAQARTQQVQDQPVAQAPTGRAGSTVGRQSLQTAQTARTQQTAQATKPAQTASQPPAQASAAPLTAAQQQAAARQATSANLAAAREREEQNRIQLNQAQQMQIARDAQQRAVRAASQIDPKLLQGLKSPLSMNGVTGAMVVAGKPIDPRSMRAAMVKQATENAAKQKEAEKQHTPNTAMPPTPPTRGGRGY